MMTSSDEWREMKDKLFPLEEQKKEKKNAWKKGSRHWPMRGDDPRDLQACPAGLAIKACSCLL